MTDARSSVDVEVLRRNIGILVEALAADVYSLPKHEAEVQFSMNVIVVTLENLAK